MKRRLHHRVYKVCLCLQGPWNRHKGRVDGTDPRVIVCIHDMSELASLREDYGRGRKLNSPGVISVIETL